MEFLKTCTTNAQAIGDFEAIAFQAFSVTRTTTPSPARVRDWNPSDDTRAVEAHLRRELHLLAPDASRPWLWLFQPTTVEKAAQSTVELPELDGYRLHREQAGSIKAAELARPPLRAGNPHATPGSNIPATTPQQTPDCFALYELFTSSVIALVSFHLVRDYSVVALNFRTFVSKPVDLADRDRTEIDSPTDLHWLTCVNASWTSSGTLLVSTFTEQKNDFYCVNDVSVAEEKLLVGRCIRVAPNGVLATIMSFDDPLESAAEDLGHRQRKRARTSSLEQSIEKWKSNVKRWLGWKGYSLPDLDKRSSWIRIRITQAPQINVPSPTSASHDRDTLWPRALCFNYRDNTDWSAAALGKTPTQPLHAALRWFETPESAGFKNPVDVAQEWYLGKPERDRIFESRRKAKKAEEDATRRKEEHPGLFPSSPLNARSGAYGDLQAVSGVYPTPPDGIAPGFGVSHSDTPSVSGATSNVILVPGGGNPTINLSAPSHSVLPEDQQLPSTSPVFPLVSDNFNTSSGNDDLFEDNEEDGYGGDGVNEEDFDFFDGPDDDDDLDMLDAPVLPDNTAAVEPPHEEQPVSISETQFDEEKSDPLAALEIALASASRLTKENTKEIKSEHHSGLQDPSSQADAEMAIETDSYVQPPEPASISKEPTPPLSPSMIAKTLQPSPPDKSASRTRLELRLDQRDKSFDPLSFSRKMSLSDAKYQRGRFGGSNEKAPIDLAQASPGPSRVKSLRDMPLLTKLRYAIGVASIRAIPEISSLTRATSEDSDSINETSDLSEEESDEDDPTESGIVVGNITLPAKRKLPTEDNATPLSVTSFADSWGGDWHELQGLQLDDASLTSFEPSIWDWSLVLCPSPAERSLEGARFSMPALPPATAQMPDTPTSQPDLSPESTDEKPLSGKDSIAITQIVTDQIVSATLDILAEEPSDELRFSTRTFAETHWQTTIKEVFPTATDCNLSALAAVHEVFPDFTPKGQQRAPPRKPSEGVAIPANHLFQIQPPFLRVRRAETHWDLLPPAVAFWETLGLSPISPPKNVVAFCIYPHSESLRPCLENFLLNIQLAYDSCKLGSHVRVETVVEFEGGLVPCRVAAPITQQEAFKVLRDTCIQLGRLLAIQHAKIREQQDSKIDAFVIYMVDPFGNPSALWELCSTFWALFQAYGQGPPGRPDQFQKPDLVLQVIPIKYIASFDVPVILEASTYIDLAREVYDRCPPSAPSGDKSPLSIYMAPAFQLEETLPRVVPFKLLPEPPQDLLRENCYMHLGYAISLDGTWITAAWTDTCGKSQAIVSYHLGTRMFREIAKEIWQTTVEILQSRRVHWRVCVAKAGVMDREEIETWVFLISCPTQLNLFITVLTVDPDPPFKFTPTISGAASQPPTNTPGSSPQAGVSPDPALGLTPAVTPSADTAPDLSADLEARLVDITDETWGIILAQRLHNSNSTTQFSPSLISGLLVKRGESYTTANAVSRGNPSPEYGPIVVGINILWIGAVGSTRATTSPFPPAGDGVSPGGVGLSAFASSSAAPSPSPTQEGVRSTSSLMWTPTPQTRSTAENLLKEVLTQFRSLGLLAKLKGMRGTRHGTVPWHVAAAKRGVTGLGKAMGGV